MSLKIVILGAAHPFRGGGITTFNERLARALQEAGHQVELVNFTVQYPGFLFPGKTQITTDAAPADLTIVRKLHSMNPISWLLTGNYIRKKQPDLVLVRYWLPFMGPAFGTVLRRIRKNRHTKIIAITDNVLPHEKRMGDQLFTRYFLPACDAFITMSKKVQQDLSKFIQQQPVLLLKHPLYDNFGAIQSKELARKQLGISPESKLVLFFGFIRAYKGLDLLLEAISTIPDSEVKLLVAGEFYEDDKPYLQQLKDLEIANRVQFVNEFIPAAEVATYFNAADLVVQPYRNATQSGVTPLAYHFEKPMIVTNVGGLPDYVEHNKTGLIAEPTATAIASAIINFFSGDPERFNAQIQEKKKELSWSAFTNSIVELFNAI